jgi:hypothetical protein
MDSGTRMTAPRPTRSDADRLRLFVALADDALSAPGLAGPFGITLNFDGTSLSGAINEPGRRALRDLLVVVRKFAMRDHDARLPAVYDAIERIGVLPDWQEGFAGAKAAYEEAQQVDNIRVQDPDEPPTDNPTFVRPREAWDLWVYGEVIHDDLAKQRRWERFVGPSQVLVREMAHDYLDMLLREAAFLRNLIHHGLVRSVDDADEAQPTPDASADPELGADSP